MIHLGDVLELAQQKREEIDLEPGEGEKSAKIACLIEAMVDLFNKEIALIHREIRMNGANYE